MPSPSQTDWAEKKAEEIVAYLPVERITTLLPQIAAALRAERERCGRIAASVRPPWHKATCGCPECMTSFEIVKLIREGE